MDEQRRTFLKILGAFGIGAMPSLAALNAATPPAFTQIGLMREVIAFDMLNSRWLIRHDILASTQWTVTHAINGETPAAEELEQVRASAVSMLDEKLKSVGKTWGDLEYLPMPSDLSITSPA